MSNHPWRTYSNEIPVKRGSWTEMQQAVADLEARGYELVSEPKEYREEFYDKGKFNYRYNTHSSSKLQANTVWKCKMRRKPE